MSNRKKTPAICRGGRSQRADDPRRLGQAFTRRVAHLDAPSLDSLARLRGFYGSAIFESAIYRRALDFLAEHVEQLEGQPSAVNEERGIALSYTRPRLAEETTK